MFDWPPDVERRVVELAVTADRRAIVKELLRTLTPHRDGSLHNPLFCNNESLPCKPVAANRLLPDRMRDHMPPILLPLYETYSDTTCFSHAPSGGTFLSEQEILAMSDSPVVDFAYHYAGMGHVTVHTYDKTRDRVVSLLDGGANGYDRADNAAARRARLAKFAVGEDEESLPFDEWWASAMTSGCV